MNGDGREWRIGFEPGGARRADDGSSTSKCCRISHGGDSTQNSFPWLKAKIHGLVREAFEHFVKLGPESVATFLKEDSTQNTITTWLDSNICTLVREAFEHFVKSGPESVAAFLKEESTQNTITWLESNIRTLVREAFEHFVKSGPESSVNRREQIQEPDRKILQLRFETSMPDHFFVGKKVKGRDGAICVKLIDATTGHVVASGPLSSLTLDVVVLAGDFNNKYDDDWTWEHFNSKVELSRPGKRLLLEGDLQVLLKRGVGSLAEFKFTDISTCRPSGKFRLGVKVEPGFIEGIRVREAKTDAFKVKHFKKGSEEKHVPRKLDDDVCKLMGIGKNGAFHENLKGAGILKVKDFLWKRCLDSEGLKKIVGKTMSEKKWETLRDHAKESVPSGKYHVYYADDTENSGIVFKNMSELCGLIEDGKYYSAETLSDGQKLLVDTLKRKASDNWKHIVEYDIRMLDMNQSAAPSEQVFVIPGPAAGDDFFIQTVAGGCHGFLGSKDVRMECRSSSSVLSENYESGSRTSFSSIGDMVSVPSGKSGVYYAKLCGLIEGGEYHSAETLSDSKKESASKKVAGDKGKAIEECVGPLQSEMTPSKRARSSQTDVVTGAPESCPAGIDRASLSDVGPPVNPGQDIRAAVPLPCQPPSVPSGEASKNSMPDFEDPSFGSSLDNDSKDRTSLLLAADENTSLDALCREADENRVFSVGGLDALCGEAVENGVFSVGDALRGEADENRVFSVGGYGDSFEPGKQLGGSNSPRNEERMKYGGGNINTGVEKVYSSGGGGGGGGVAVVVAVGGRGMRRGQRLWRRRWRWRRRRGWWWRWRRRRRGWWWRGFSVFRICWALH